MTGLEWLDRMPGWVIVAIIVLAFINLLSIMVFAMDMRKIIAQLRKEVMVKHLFYIFVIPGFICAWIPIGIYLFFKGRVWRGFLNFRVWPRPEWVPFIARWSIFIVAALVLLFLTGGGR